MSKNYMYSNLAFQIFCYFSYFFRRDQNLLNLILVNVFLFLVVRNLNKYLAIYSTKFGLCPFNNPMP